MSSQYGRSTLKKNTLTEGKSLKEPKRENGKLQVMIALILYGLGTVLKIKNTSFHSRQAPDSRISIYNSNFFGWNQLLSNEIVNEQLRKQGLESGVVYGDRNGTQKINVFISEKLQ